MSRRLARATVMRAIGGWCLFGSMLTPSGAATPDDPVRLLPYPFAHIVTFASDADMQRPWHGAANHRFFNEELGLTTSDSLWPQGGSKFASSLFLGPGQLNRAPSGVGTEPTFALLLRQWHRGNIDHFHSWHEDGPIAARNEIKPALPLSSERNSQKLPAVTPALQFQPSRNVRFYFSAAPPEDLSIILHDTEGRTSSFGPSQIARGRQIQIEVGPLGWIVEVIVPPRSSEAPQSVYPMMIDRIDFVAPSCAKGCPAALTRVERDHFSRNTVLSQIPWLEMWNIRPATLTSHGGNTLMQDFGVPGGAAKFTAIADPAVFEDHEALADQKQSHAYHSDLLRKLGVLAVWSYYLSGEFKHIFLAPAAPVVQHGLPPLTSHYEGLYDLPRADPWLLDVQDQTKFDQSAAALFPDLPYDERKALYCGPGCTSSQGNALGYLVAQHLYLVDHAMKVKSLIYTHFGSEDGTNNLRASPEEPVTPTVRKWMQRFANHVHNFDGTVGPDRRVWSPPANTWLRYQVMHAGIASQLNIEPDGSTITIAPWTDPITKTTWPDLRTGTRDVHGLTIYVSDAERASVKIADKTIDSFTRNPPDETGKASITLVDDHVPTSIVGRVALKDRADIAVVSGRFADISGGASNISLEADESGQASVAVKPWSLDLWNTSHLRLAVRKRCGSENKDDCLASRFKIELMMQDGGTVSVLEEGQGDATNASIWSVPALRDADQWATRTLDVAQLTWPRPVGAAGVWRRPPLPIGRVQEVRLSLTNAVRGTALDIRDVNALRPSGNGEAPDGTKLVAGRVTLDGMTPVPRAEIRATSVSGNAFSTASDDDGYYFLPRQAKGDILDIHAQVGSLQCFPMQGRRIEANKDEAEVDIEIGNCIRRAGVLALGEREPSRAPRGR